MKLSEYINQPRCPEDATFEDKLAHLDTLRRETGEVKLSKDDVVIHMIDNTVCNVVVLHYGTLYRLYENCQGFLFTSNGSPSVFSLDFNPFI